MLMQETYQKIPLIHTISPYWSEFDNLPLKNIEYEGAIVQIRDFSNIQNNTTVRIFYKSINETSAFGIHQIKTLQENHINEVGMKFPKSEIKRSADGSFMIITFKK